MPLALNTATVPTRDELIRITDLLMSDDEESVLLGLALIKCDSYPDLINLIRFVNEIRYQMSQLKIHYKQKYIYWDVTARYRSAMLIKHVKDIYKFLRGGKYRILTCHIINYIMGTLKPIFRALADNDFNQFIYELQTIHRSAAIAGG